MPSDSNELIPGLGQCFVNKSEEEDEVKVAAQKRKYCLDKNFSTLGAGVFLLFFAVVLHLFWDKLISVAVNKEFILTETSKSHDIWVKNVIPLYINFYFFNWTNPSELKSESYKPVFEEVGPYRFREDVEKSDIIWNSNGTVTYKKLRRWYFVPEGSVGSLNDSITTLNVVALAAAYTTRNWISLARAPLSIALSQTQKVHVTKRVGEFLFEGYEDPLIKLANSIPGLSSQVPFDRFGWFYKRNGSTDFDGIFNMETGSNGMENFGKIASWNYKNTTSFYDDHCSEVKGSAGEFWPPNRSKNDDIYLFTPDMCRYIGYKYKEDATIEGISGYRYESGSLLFDNGTADPENECFCGGECVPSGTVNVSSCRFGTPGFISYPHFYLADPYYRESVVGMNPDPQKHEMYIILEPFSLSEFGHSSGGGSEAADKYSSPTNSWYRVLFNDKFARLMPVETEMQTHNLMRGIKGIGTVFVPCLVPQLMMVLHLFYVIYEGVPKIFFPMIWFEQKVTIPNEMVYPIKILLALSVMGTICYVLLYSIGFTFLFIYVSRICFPSKRFSFTKRDKAKDNSFRKKILRASYDL